MLWPSGDQPVTMSSAESKVSRRGPAALDRDDENVVAAVAIGGEGDPFAVGAEDRVDVMLFVHGDMAGRRRRWSHHPDVAEVAEGDGFAVRRNVRRAGEANRLLSVQGRGENEEKRRKKNAFHGWDPQRS